MGTWVIYDPGGRWSVNEADVGMAPIGYLAVHDSPVGHNNNLTHIGEHKQRIAGVYHNTIYRLISMFDTARLVGLTPTGATIYVSAGITPGTLSKDLVFHVVRGVGVNNIPVGADYGYLLAQVISYGSLNMPMAGQAFDVWRQVVLNPAGLAEFNLAGWTKYGWRSDDDRIVLEPPDSPGPGDSETRWYNPFELGAGLLNHIAITNDATTTPGFIHFSGRLTEAFVVQLNTMKMLVTVTEPIDGSNIDVQFRYTGPVNGQTPWINNQIFDVDFVDSAGILPTGLYNYRVWIRLNDPANPALPWNYVGAEKAIFVDPYVPPPPAPTVTTLPATGVT
jgi:hypothetical protein